MATNMVRGRNYETKLPMHENELKVQGSGAYVRGGGGCIIMGFYDRRQAIKLVPIIKIRYCACGKA